MSRVQESGANSVSGLEKFHTWGKKMCFTNEQPLSYLRETCEYDSIGGKEHKVMIGSKTQTIQKQL